MAKKAKKKPKVKPKKKGAKKKLAGVRLPLPKQTGGKHKDKTKYDRKQDADITAMLNRVDQLTREFDR